MEINFTGKRALVTGGSRGIGKEIVKKLIQCGADVVALSRNQANLDALKREIPKVTTVCVDVGDYDLTKATVEGLGHFDLLVNNAAIISLSSIDNLTEEEFDKMINVNLKSALNISKVVAKSMINKRTGGSIVNISSIVGIFAWNGVFAYGASKAAMDFMTKSMALEYGPHGIRVNGVNPSGINTDMLSDFAKLSKSAGVKEDVEDLVKNIPLGRFGEVDDVADPVIFLLSDLAKFINGISLIVDGGQTTHL